MKNKKISVLVLICFLILFMGASFAWLNISLNGSKTNILKAGYLSLYLDETETEGINIEKAIPTSDSKGLTQEGYSFKLVNKGKTSVNYTIYLDDLELEENETRMPDSVVKYNLTKNGVEGSTVLLTSIGTNPKRIVDTGTIEANTTNTYTLKLWMDYEATIEVMDTVFSAQLRIDAEQGNIKVEESDMTVDVTDNTQKLELEEDITNYTVESSDPSIATIDETTGKIIPRSYGLTTFRLQNKTTGAKKNITVTITKTLTATYVKQVGVDSIEKETDTCKLSEKDQTTCSITLPSITPSNGYSVVGWNKDKTSHTGIIGKIDISEDTNIYTIMQKDAITYTATFNKPSVGVSAIGNNTLSCTIPAVYNDETQDTSCKIKLPTIETLEGYTSLGWNEEENATTGTLPNTEIEISSNKIFYGIVKKDAITLSAKFYKNGATSQDNNTDEYITKSCVLEEKYNGEAQATECSITTPTIEASSATPIVVGYSETNDSITASIQPNTSLTINSNKEYYAITKSEIKTLTATFYKNGATSLDGDTSDYITKQCNIPGTYNGIAQATGCDITSPVIAAPTATPTVVGYSTEPTNHNSIWSSNEIKSISESANYYAQTKKDEITYTATFEIGKNVQSIGKENASCTIDATYNGEIQGTSCSVEGPSITQKIGYTSVGWSTTNGSTTGTTSLELTSNTTFYANATANSYTVEYYDGTTKLGSSGVKVDEELTLTTIAALNGEKVGYTFKGWATTEGSTQVVHNDGATVSNLATTEGSIVKLYGLFVDDIKPICSFSSTKEIYVTEEDTLTLTCTDEGSKITNANLQISNFEVSNSNGEIVSVTSPTIVTNGYQYTVTIKGLSAGTTIDTNGEFTISLKENSIIDNSSNGNIKTTSQTEIVKGLTYTQSYTTSTGVESITSTQTSCTTILTNLTCDVTLPGINASEGYTQD